MVKAIQSCNVTFDLRIRELSKVKSWCDDWLGSVPKVIESVSDLQSSGFQTPWAFMGTNPSQTTQPRFDSWGLDGSELSASRISNRLTRPLSIRNSWPTFLFSKKVAIEVAHNLMDFDNDLARGPFREHNRLDARID
jgi:hypothetical protein